MPLPTRWTTSGTRSSSAGATNFTIGLPGTRVTGNLLIGWVGTKNNETHTWPAGWNKVAQVNSGTGWTVSYAWAWVTGSEAAPNVTWTSSVASFGQIHQYNHWGPGGRNPIGATNSNTGTTSTHSCTGVTTTGDGSTVIYLDAAAANTALGTPSGWTEWFDVAGATGATRNVGGGKTINASGTASGNISVTGAAAAWVMWQIEILAYLPSTGAASSPGDMPEVAPRSGQGIAPNVPPGLASERGHPGPGLRALQRFSDRTLRNRPGLHLAAAEQGQYSYTGSGGLTLAGAATLEKAKVFTASGSLTLAGSAALAKTRGFLPSGGMTFGGAAVTAKVSVRSYTATGGLTLAGAAELAKTKAATGAGGLTLAGAADKAKVRGWIASGGIQLAGSADLEKTKAFSGSGGLTFAGAATTSYTAGSAAHEYTGSGGMQFAGAAEWARVKAASGSGGLVLAGGASWSREWVLAASGGVQFAGAAQAARVKAFTPSGGLTLAGAAVTSITSAGSWAYTGSGGITLAGAADLAKIKAPSSSGGLTLGGAADTTIAKLYAYDGAGGLTFGGAAVTVKLAEYGYTGVGGITLAGAAELLKVKAVDGAGGLALSGAAVTSYTPGILLYQYTGSGQLTFDGAALTDGPRLEPELVVAPPSGGQPSTTTRFRRGSGVSKDTLDLIGELAKDAKRRPHRVAAETAEGAVAKAAGALTASLAEKVAKQQITPEKAREIAQHNALVLSMALMVEHEAD